MLLDWVIKGGGRHLTIRCLRAEEQGNPGRCVKKMMIMIRDHGLGAEKRPGRFRAYVWRRGSSTQGEFQLLTEHGKNTTI